VFRGFGFIAKTRSVWLFAAIPCVLLVALFVSGASYGLSSFVPALLSGISPETSLGKIGAGALRFLVSLLAIVAAGMIAAWLTPMLSGPALERIVVARERSLGVPDRPPVSFFTELWCGIRAQILGLLVGGPVLLVLWLVTLAAPPLAAVTVPAKLVTVSALVSWSLLDYPLSLRGLRLRQRLALMRSGLLAVLGFGAAVALIFAIPLGAVLLLPAGVAAAAELAVRLESTARQTGRGHSPP
jgi:CysZ protein